jgi:hypothetical protein
MNWDAIGAVGEVLGAMAVVVSLLYLAAQIRLNSRIVKGERTHNITQTIQTELRWSGDYAEVFVKMLQDSSSLTDVEAFKLGEWLTAAMMARQNEYIQYRQDLVDEDIWLANRGIIKSILSMPWCRNWWENFDKVAFVPGFVELVDTIMEEDHQFDYGDYLRSISGRRSTEI